MLVFPMVPALSNVKVLFFALIIAGVGVTVFATGESGLHTSVVVWTLSLSLLSFVFVLEGAFAGAPGVERTAETYVLWPIVYLLVIAGVRSRRLVDGLVVTVIASTLWIAIYSLVYLLIRTNVVPENRYFELISFDWEHQMFALNDGFIIMQFPGINSLPFLLPFSIAALATFSPRNGGMRAGFRALLWATASFSVVAALISGRRGLYLVTLAAPLFTYLLLRFQPIAERRTSKKALIRVAAVGVVALVVLLMFTSAVYGIGPSSLIGRVSAGLNFGATSEEGGATERRVQFHALLAGWMDSPLMGAGHGSPAYGSIQSGDSPWNYELHYAALLYQTGLIGFAAYASGILWIYWMGVRVIRAGGYASAVMVALLVGLSSVLVADATNPYLARYDAMWAIFLPLAVINWWLVERTSPRLSVLPGS
jgi:hypothetical protein